MSRPPENKGCDVNDLDNVVALLPEEAVRLDHDQLEVLVAQMGPVGADHLVSHAMEELAVLLARLVRICRATGSAEEFKTSVRALVAIAQQVGMTRLARVGRDLLVLADGHDGLAFAAVMARLARVGERSLNAVWDLQDMRV